MFFVTSYTVSAVLLENAEDFDIIKHLILIRALW